MTKERVNIAVLKDGQLLGYVKSISYKQGTFKIIANKAEARKYASLDAVQGDIDFLTSISGMQGFIFIYN